MHLYHFNLQAPTAITAAITGQFSEGKGEVASAKQQEIIVARGSVLELLRQEGESNRLTSVYSQEVFGVIRSLVPFRLPQGTKDYIVVGSDSGRIVILEFDSAKQVFNKLHQETFGKTGCRRIVPGQYLAADPRGRAIMVGAIEKQKFVYVLNRDAQNRLTISSPLEAHKSHTVCYSMVALDVGFENPTFACLELDHSVVSNGSNSGGSGGASGGSGNSSSGIGGNSNSNSSSGNSSDIRKGEESVHEDSDGLRKMLTIYELDLGLNHVVKKASMPVDRSANMLIPVPGGGDGPGGVLVCSQNFITYKNLGHPDVRAPIARRHDMPPERGLMMVSWAMHRKRNLFFFMVQSEMGDLYKMTLQSQSQASQASQASQSQAYEFSTVQSIQVSYFDTLPVSNSLCILRMGYLFVASEFSDHRLYRFKSIGDEQPTVTSAPMESSILPTIRVRQLKNLAPVQQFDSFAPIMDIKVKDLTGEGQDQFYTLTGRGAKSSLRILRHGLNVIELGHSPLGGTPHSIWSVKQNVRDPHDRFIIVSFAHSTMVLAIDKTVSQVFDSGLQTTVSTLYAGLLGDSSLLQVHTNGLRIIDSNKRIVDWDSEKATVSKCAVNESQVILALSSNELVYFYYDKQTQQLLERDKKEMGQDVASLALGAVPLDMLRTRFLAVGFYDKTCRILSLDDQDCLNTLTRQALPADPESLAIVEMLSSASMTGTGGSLLESNPSSSTGSLLESAPALYLHMGLSNGVWMRSMLDRVTGELSDTRSRFLGNKGVKLITIPLVNEKHKGHQQALLALCTRAWFCYSYQGKIRMSPLSIKPIDKQNKAHAFAPLEHVSSFSSEQCAQGLVAISMNNLRILVIEKLGEVFHQRIVPLQYTPRRMVIHPQFKTLIILQTDHNAFNASEKQQNMLEEQQQQQSASMQSQQQSVQRQQSQPPVQQQSQPPVQQQSPVRQQPQQPALPEREYGSPKPPHGGKWASTICIVDAEREEILYNLELQDNEAGFSCCIAPISSRGNELFLIVGTSQSLSTIQTSVVPSSNGVMPPPNGAIHVYKFLDQGKKIQLVHRTAVEDVPLSVCPFQGRLLVGVRNMLRIYDMGKRKLLRKCENKNFPHTIASIHTQGDRIYVADIAESFHFCKYKKQDNLLIVFADDTVPRWITASLQLDYDTMAGADKFGNVFVVRLPQDASDEVQTLHDVDLSGLGAAATASSNAGANIGSGANRWMWERGLLNGAPQKTQELVQFHVGSTITTLTKFNHVSGTQGVIMYGTITGAIGILIPFATREDTEFCQLLEMHLREELPPLCGRDHLAYRSYYYPVKGVVDGQLCEQFTVLLDANKQKQVAQELERSPSEIAKRLEDIRHLAGF